MTEAYYMYLPVCPCMCILKRPFCRACIKMRKISFSGVRGMVRELVAAKCSKPVLVTPNNSPIVLKIKQC